MTATVALSITYAPCKANGVSLFLVNQNQGQDEHTAGSTFPHYTPITPIELTDPFISSLIPLNTTIHELEKNALKKQIVLLLCPVQEKNLKEWSTESELIGTLHTIQNNCVLILPYFHQNQVHTRHR